MTPEAYYEHEGADMKQYVEYRRPSRMVFVPFIFGAVVWGLVIWAGFQLIAWGL